MSVRQRLVAGAHARLQHALDRDDEPLELLALRAEPLAAGGGEGVVAGAAVVLGRAPFGVDPAVQQQALERRIQRALADLQHLLGHLTQPFGDAVAMLRRRSPAFGGSADRACLAADPAVYSSVPFTSPIVRRWEGWNRIAGGCQDPSRDDGTRCSFQGASEHGARARSARRSVARQRAGSPRGEAPRMSLEPPTDADHEALDADGDRRVVVLRALEDGVLHAALGDRRPLIPDVEARLALHAVRCRSPTVCSTIAAVIGVSVLVGTGEGPYA